MIEETNKTHAQEEDTKTKSKNDQHTQQQRWKTIQLTGNYDGWKNATQNE